jgi:hypothetical protein
MKPGLPGGRPPERVPGLPSVHKARLDRNRGKFSRATSGFWLWAAAGLAVVLIGYRVVSGRELEEAKAELLAKQRAVESSVGSEWFPLRDHIENLVLSAAAHADPDAVDPETAAWGFRTMPGLYLRLRLADAKDLASLRRAASSSQKDGFVGCLLREPNAPAARGEVDAGAFAEQPWNWQNAYAATRILTDDWTEQVKSAPDPLRLKVFQEQYEKAVSSEIPLAIDLVRRAQFFLLVLDEDSEEARGAAEGGIVSEAVLQRTPHYARVHLYNLRTAKEALSLRRSAEASFVFAGEHGATDPETLDALQRQVNNCALAKEVDRAIALRPQSASPP